MVRRTHRWLTCFTVIASTGCRSPEPPRVATDSVPALPDWLASRVAADQAAAAGSAAVHDFRFEDRIDSSGITFANPIVDDAGKSYKPVHYDHGTGLAAADVDGDGRIDLYFVSQLGSSELWHNDGAGRFSNATDTAGLRMTDAIAVAASFADTDNDGDPDLFVTTVRHGNRYFENLGGGRFQDRTVAAGLGYSGHSSGATFFDYDRDGLVDLFVANVGRYTTEERGAGGYYVGVHDAFLGHRFPDRTETSILYRNVGGHRFEDVSRRVGLGDDGWSGDAVVVNVNGDAWPDLYTMNMQGADHLWLNQGGRRFVDATAQYFPATPWGAMGAAVFDFDGDDRLDLFVTDMHSDMWMPTGPGDWAGEERKADTASPRMSPDFFPNGKRGFIFGNALFVDRGGRFVEISDSARAENYWPWGPSVGDLNADGYPDLFIASSMNFPFRYAVNSVLLNERGRRFLRAEFLLGVEPRADRRTEKVWFRLECQGKDRENVYCVGCFRPGAHESQCRFKDPSGGLTVMGAVGSRAALIADLDSDGDLDIVTNEFHDRPQVLISDLTSRRAVHALTVRLVGSKSNRSGIGAAVTVVLPDGRRLLQQAGGKSGYLSQSDLPLYFGLGDAATAASVEVAWPSGARQVVAGPHPSGRIVEVREP